MRIPSETGMRWIEVYNKKNNIQGRLGLTGYSVSATQLTAVLNSIPQLTGVVFHHGTDALGVHHFMIIPIDESLRIWNSIPGRIVIDANTNTAISLSTANNWATNYELTHPGEIWFHYFGRNIFDEIAAVSYFDQMNIVPAINDMNLLPQLLLIISDEPLSTSGRVSEDRMRIYDASSACPPCAVE